jgi:hypothetical protein
VGGRPYPVVKSLDNEHLVVPDLGLDDMNAASVVDAEEIDIGPDVRWSERREFPPHRHQTEQVRLVGQRRLQRVFPFGGEGAVKAIVGSGGGGVDDLGEDGGFDRGRHLHNKGRRLVTGGVGVLHAG